ncbi:receptor-like protein 12 [Durio zibethinus]|uniref:Receptor-like protein 12 n=1 Tax=Durio zibethinus TaxID=66656 RepID=A0A6P5WPP9_DURZI|nr:receptor-like protein 12 [Durio zibethinus]
MRYLPILYQLLCFLLFLCIQATLLSSSSSATQLCSRDESSALFQFKTLFSIKKTASIGCENIRSYPKTNSWKEGIDCCLWDGVSCDNITGHVINLDLSCSWLSGTLPSNTSLFLLSNLQRLDLSFNDFKKSKISSKFGRFASLTHLDLSNSWFSGRVPYEISYLSKLVFLNLSPNPSVYLIDSSQALEPKLKLEKSTLNGIVRNLTEVREIILDGIDMSSVDPKSFMNLSYSLTSLSLTSCDLRRKFPENSFSLPNIKKLILNGNPSLTGQFPKPNWSSPLEVLDTSLTSFSGELPESIGNLKSLLGLDLTGCNFSGSIPISLGNLSQRRFLFLSVNNFSGEIPSSFTNLTQLAILQICSNRLEGSIPDNPNAFPNLGFLDLSNNLLSGTTPSWLYTHPSLSFLDLGNNHFQGSIPSSISKLVNLTVLDLSSNSLNGTISWDMFSELQNLNQLHLSSNTLSLSSTNRVNFVLPNLEYVNSSSNNFNEFPSFLKGSKKLNSLDLSYNRIDGQISNFPWKDIKFLDLHSNFIQGDLPILPRNITFLSVSNNNLTGDISDICSVKFLEILDMSHNNFRGIIPQCIGSFSQRLSSLNLKMNKFHGIIPPTFAKGCGLKNLNLNSNHLGGPLTQSISNCKDLEVLDLGNNKINDTFPHWIEALSELQVLVLSSNKFAGSTGASKNPQSLPKLRIIDLSNNSFFGPLPTSYIKNFRGMMNLDKGKARSYMQERNYSYDYSVALVVKGLEIELVKILTIFTSIDFSNNKFEGEIPRIIGELSSLRGLNLSHNNLVGHIPSSLGNMTSLEWLDLSSNRLGGQIPRELVDLTFLSFFNVSCNQLVGPIPQGKQFNTFENGSYEGNKGLCGPPLSRGCSGNESQQPAPWMNSGKDDGSKLEFGWKVVLIGYGFGFIFGVAIGCFALRMGESSHNVLEALAQRLSSLNLKMNKFHGIIPPTFAKGCGLKNLNLNSNHLGGPLTQSISNCKGLGSARSWQQQDKRYFPHWIEALSELQVLVLSSNKFAGSTGASKNPQSLPKLRIIDLSNNSFFGPLPTSYIKNFRGMMNLDKGKARSYMQERNYSIDFSNNKFEGEIPRIIGELSSLRGLNLSHNNLVGHIPSSLGNMTSLEWQAVHTFENGSYEGNKGLCGPPLSRGCSGNESQQPASWMNSGKDDGSKLEFGWKVVLTGYGFGFIFGVAIGCFALRMVDLSSNKFQRKIPKIIGKLSSVIGLNLSHNNLIGHITPLFGNLINLEWLDLSLNKLDGKNPEQLLNLKWLSFLNLSDNELVRRIPQGKQFSTFENSSYEGNARLCGFPLSRDCSSNQAQQPPEKDHSKSEIRFGWKVVLIGYMSGFTFGLAMGYVVFRTGKPKWFVTLVVGKCHRRTKKSSPMAHCK